MPDATDPTTRWPEASTWMLTGGAGYIGAHIVRALLSSGRRVVVIDDLSTGVRENVPPEVPFVEANVLDRLLVTQVLREHGVHGVIHLAAKKAAGESVDRPLHYYRHNVVSTLELLEAMGEAQVNKLVFSSSAAVYGTPAVETVSEDSPTRPESPYGETKLISEWMMRDVARATPLNYIALRYFNVAGAGAPELGDRGVFNLIPLVFQALADGRAPQVFGNGYKTRDGSCIRDYIHVADLAEAHVAAVRRLDESTTTKLTETYNIGRGEGVTVFEVLDTVRAVTGIDFTAETVARRAGDPQAVSASAHAADEMLGWRATRDLHEMVRSAWDAWQFLGARAMHHHGG